MLAAGGDDRSHIRPCDVERLSSAAPEAMGSQQTRSVFVRQNAISGRAGSCAPVAGPRVEPWTGNSSRHAFETLRSRRETSRGGSSKNSFLTMFVYRVRLHSSYDGNPRVGDEVVYPEDGAYDKADAGNDCGEEEVVEVLWREGRVPEWINVC
jgi:hypothetical protein